MHSFGILFWEILTGKVPFKGVDKKEFYRDVISRGCRPSIPDSLPAVLSNLLTDCWRKEPAARPSFASILTTLNAVLVEGEHSASRSSSSRSSGGGGGGRSTRSPRKKSPGGSSLWFGINI